MNIKIVLAEVIVLSSLVMGQTVSPERDTSGTSTSTASSTSSIPNPPVNIPQVSSSAPSYNNNFISNARDYHYQSFPATNWNGSYPYINPRSSFWCCDNYYKYQQLFDFLTFNYGYIFDNRYFSRFYLNNEPLINTKIAQYAMQIPLYNVKRLLVIADRLRQLRGIYTSNNIFRNPEFRSLVLQVKEIAKKLQKHPTLEYLDIENRTKLPRIKQEDYNYYLDQMDNYIRKLQNQFSDIINMQSPLISVDQLLKPSILSLTKDIERLAIKLEKLS